ncbi:NACHT domain-containing protein [Shewanella spartinae]|uniref:NACHT domain-containing protein n=1 Tax=Shewanella spartinae TaxID=2864205 RepID=UPI001C662315|nr:NACHT domain-containing protein [Shewanella spartinae]QYJ93349.1 NACHT domain-containing protein [Shewanella spartinae]
MDNDFVNGSERSLSKSISGDVYSEAKKWFQKIDPKNEKLNTYREGIEHSLNKVQIMGMSNAKKISHIYVSLKIYPNYRKHLSDTPKVNSVYNPDNDFNVESGSLSFNADSAIRSLGYGHIVDKEENKSKTVDKRKPLIESCDNKVEGTTKSSKLLRGREILSFVESTNTLLVLGQPGGGKTTFLKYLSLVYTGFIDTGSQIKPLLPVYIPLRDYSKQDNLTKNHEWFLNFTLCCASEVSGGQDTRLWFMDQLTKGNCLLLVDGIDELPASVSKDVLASFRSFANKYRSNKYVATCRTASYHHSLEGFKICEVDDFDHEEVISFSKHWFQDEKKLKKFLGDLEKSLVAKELCKTPLLMTMVCLMYDYNRSIPENRFELYQSCVDTLMYKWDTFREIDRCRRVTEISNSRKTYILSNIARKTLDNESIFLRKHDLCRMFSDEINLLGLEVSADELLFDMESNMGIFVEKSNDIYSFSHLTFQEFFAALSFIERGDVEKLFDLAYKSDRYREVFLLAVERIHSPDKLAVTLAARVKYDYINAGVGSTYHCSILHDMLLSQAVFTKKIRELLKMVHLDLIMYS